MNSDALARLTDLGYDSASADLILAHLRDADARGKPGHGVARLSFLEQLPGLDARARPQLVEASPGFQRWHGRGALGYLTLAAICAAQQASPPEAARVVVAEQCFPSGHLGYWVRQLATAGLIAVLTATSPRRLPHPNGGPALTGTNPLAIGVPSSDGRPIVSDVSMGRATHGDVLLGRASPADRIPFGGDQAHKAFAMALGLQLLVDALVRDGPGAVLLVARPQADPVPALRELARGARLPGDA